MADTAAPPPPAAPAPGLPAAPGSNPLSRKLNKILETRLDNDKEMLEALKALSTFFVENSLRTRRNLRGDIERRSLAINEEFVHIFKQVKEELESINEDVQAMSSCCEDMSSRLKAAKEQTQDLIVKTTKLQAENQRLEMKAQVADAFIAKFQLTPDEMNLLRGTKDEPITEDFFKALGRVKQIHDDVKILLRTNQQRAGLEIMEQMALLQETSYERLYRWTQNECRTLTQESCDISPVLAQAMEALQDRPVLYKYTLDEFGTARRSAVVRGFIDALTRGGLGGTPRPIEMHSHDPLRYVGDMLAWLHQATASEKEHLEAMLKLVTIPGIQLESRSQTKSKKDLSLIEGYTEENDLWRSRLPEVYLRSMKDEFQLLLGRKHLLMLQHTTAWRYICDLFCNNAMSTSVLNADGHIVFMVQAFQNGVEENTQEVVGHITEGVCRPLKVRIEQVIVAEPGAVLLYKISNLLKFYHHTISGIVGNSAATLLTTIEEMHLLSKKIFFNSLSLHASKLMDKVELPPPDLGPSSALNQTLNLLREVLSSHDSSVVPLDARQADFVQVLSCVLDPLLQMCTMSASNLGTADMATFMVNSLYMMKTTLALFEFTDKRLEMLQFQIEAHLDTLINEQASYVLTRAGLSYIYNSVQQHKPEQGPLSNLPSMDSVSLKVAMAQFDRYLSAPDSLLMSQLNFLLSATVKEQIIKQSTELVCRAYSELYAAVMDPSNDYKDPETILHRSPHQVQALLS